MVTFCDSQVLSIRLEELSYAEDYLQSAFESFLLGLASFEEFDEAFGFYRDALEEILPVFPDPLPLLLIDPVLNDIPF